MESILLHCQLLRQDSKLVCKPLTSLFLNRPKVLMRKPQSFNGQLRHLIMKVLLFLTFWKETSQRKSEDVHSLEEGIDHVVLASKYGLPDRAFVLGDQAPFISMAVEMSKDHPELLSTYLHGVVADLRVRSMSLNNLPEGELEGWIGGLADFVRS